jgi:uncharacterized cysteine cluster protein YcgN (CxxCxxCC family)
VFVKSSEKNQSIYANDFMSSATKSVANINQGETAALCQGCQMVCFQTKKILVWENFGGLM